MQICGDIMGPGLRESFHDLLARHQTRLLISFGGKGLLFMDDYASSIFLRSWALVGSYLCFRFCIFDRPILEDYVF